MLIVARVEILKQPVHTSVAIEKKDFEHFLVEDSLHVVIHLKDFKAVIAHAEAAGVMITARYTNPCRPLQFAYDFAGVKTEFTLMTTGESDASNVSSSSRAAVPQLSARQTPAPVNVSQTNTAPITRQMPPPRSRSVRPLTGNSARGTAEASTQSQRPPASINFDSLFVPADDDRQWDVSNEDERDETEDMLGWDATTDQVWTPQLPIVSQSNLRSGNFQRKYGTEATGHRTQYATPGGTSG